MMELTQEQLNIILSVNAVIAIVSIIGLIWYLKGGQE